MKLNHYGRIFILVSTLFYMFVGTSHAQDTVLASRYKGVLDSIQSKVLGQKRYIQVFIPPAYKKDSNEKYDVLYVLDGGNWNTSVIAQVQQFVEGQGQMPPTIIASVTGIDRNKELTPTHLDSWKESGGAADFLAYIKTELIPHVNAHYPSNGDNTLWGHSLSGMFAVYTMLQEPALFKSVIAADPSMWWDNGLVQKMAAAKLPAFPNTSVFLYVSGRQGPDFHGMGIDSFETVLRQNAPPNLHWKIVPYTDETHSSIRLKTTYDGLRYTYAGLVANIEFAPANGMMVDGKPIKLWYFDDTVRMHYTTDGTVPTESSPGVVPEITLNGPATVMYKRFSNREKYDKLVKGNFTPDAMPPPLPALPKKKNVQAGGFNYSYYEGNWTEWPDIGSLKPALVGITDKAFDPEKLPRKNNYALVIEGWLEAKTAGYYLFILQADKHSKLWLGGKCLMEWNGNYNHMNDSYIVPLKKGFYPFRLEYLHNKEDFKLRYSWLTPATMESKDPAPIPLELQFGVR